MKSIYLVIYLVSPPGAAVVPQEVVAEMASEAECRQEAERIGKLPYVADKISGYYKLDASCHDEDYIKRQQ
jgi:hypothetical protein